MVRNAFSKLSKIGKQKCAKKGFYVCVFISFSICIFLYTYILVAFKADFSVLEFEVFLSDNQISRKKNQINVQMSLNCR